jgi:hypothetical protein
MGKVISKDGTVIAFDKSGEGAAIIPPFLDSPIPDNK